MKHPLINKLQKLLSTLLFGKRENQKSIGALRFSPVSQFVLSPGSVAFINDLKVKDITVFDTGFVKSADQIVNCLDAFVSPFKTATLVKDGNGAVVGTLNLSGVLSHLKISFDLQSLSFPDFTVSCIMDNDFVPLEFDMPVSGIFVDILNCDCPIHPVYYNNTLKGILYKEMILDIIKFQMLEEALLTKQVPPCQN